MTRVTTQTRHLPTNPDAANAIQTLARANMNQSPTGTAAAGYRATNFTVGASSQIKVPIDTLILDDLWEVSGKPSGAPPPAGSYNLDLWSANAYVCPIPGIYWASWYTGTTTSGQYYIQVRKNGGQDVIWGNESNTTWVSTGSGVFECAQGDTIEAWLANDGAGGITIAGGSNRFSVVKVA